MAPPCRAYPPCARSYFLLLLLALLPSYLVRRAAAQSQPADDTQLLLQIKSAWGDPPALAGWDASSPRAPCDWPFVGCDGTAGRVTNLTIASAGVAGPFPADAVGGLSALTHLDVSNNSISGAFPTTPLSLCFAPIPGPVREQLQR